MAEIEYEEIKPNALGNILKVNPAAELVEQKTLEFKSNGSLYWYSPIDFNDVDISQYNIEICYLADDELIPWSANPNKPFDLTFDFHKYYCNENEYSYAIVSSIRTNEQKPNDTDVYIRLVPKQAKTLILGQKAEGVNNTDCFKLGIFDSNRKKYIRHVAYVDKLGNLSYLSRRLVERLVSSDSLSQQNSLGAGAASTAVTPETRSISVNAPKIWMGWIPFESGHAYDDKEAVFDVGDHKHAYGMFNFDITTEGGSGVDLCEFFQLTIAKGYPYFKDFAKFNEFPPNPNFDQVANAFNYAKNTATPTEILEMAHMQISVADHKYLTKGVNVVKKAQDRGLLEGWTDIQLSGLIGSLWSFANRCGGGLFLDNTLNAMQNAKSTNFEAMMRAGYQYQFEHHTNKDEKPRWDPSRRDYNSEYWALMKYVNEGPSDDSMYRRELNAHDFTISTFISGNNYTTNYFINSMLSLEQFPHDFGFFGQQDFEIELNLFTLQDLQKQNNSLNYVILANTICDEVVPKKEEDFKLSEYPGYMLKTKDLKKGNKIYFVISNGYIVSEFDTGISLVKSNSINNYNELNIKIIKKINSKTKLYSFIFYANNKKTNEISGISIDSTYEIRPNDSRKLLINIPLKGQEEISSDEYLYLYNKLEIKGVSPRHDVVNTFSKDFSLGFYSNQNIQSD